MHTALLFAITFLSSLDTAAVTPAEQNVNALLTRFEATRPTSATIAMQDGKRIVVLQAPEMAVEVRAAKPAKTVSAANAVGGLAMRIAGKKAVERQA